MKTAVCILLMVFASPAFAITDEEIFRNFQFSFVNPGARSTGMGNAFVALADDATAAEANPAGLTILRTPEVSLEYRHTRFDSETLNEINNVSTAQQAIRIESFNNLESLNRPSFFSIVYPFRGITFAFSRQEAVRIQGSIDELFHFEVPDNAGGIILIDAGALGNVDQSVVNWNFSAAKRFGRLSLGGSLRVSHLDWETDVQNFFLSFGSRIDTFQTSIQESATSLAFNVGAIYSPVPKVFLGAVYKRNARFEVTELETGDFAMKPGPVTNVLKIPDTFAIGVAVKPNDIITFSSDLVRIEYSDLIEGFESGYNLVTARYTNQDISYDVENAYEFHFGAEFFVMLGKFPVALRNGYYRKPSNALTVTNTAGVLPFDVIVARTIFAELDGENHITIGGGIAFYDFQIDLAVDSAKSSTNFVLSTVYRF
jgi:long-subunit fatty acid transport protein